MESETHLDAGTYALVNTENSRYALDTKDGLAVVHPYIASRSQQWKLTTADGVFWHVQNEVDHKFSWHVKNYLKSQHYQLYMPYSKHIVDVDPKEMKPGSSVVVNRDSQRPRQVWKLCRDLHLNVSSTLKDGNIYKITQPHCKGFMTLGLDTKGGFFRAVETDHGWAFQHVQTQKYLGIPPTIILDDAVQVSTVGKPFSWMVIPNSGNPKSFEIWLPFASRVLNLYRDGKVMLVGGTLGTDYATWWHYEPCDEELPSDTHEALESDRKNKECIPGPEERPSGPRARSP
ncbi:hypothetical protein BKA70DRAFT_1354804 [Coprinopsis sp. MPI-PUGE-AT-0042]|nr:hypothetical protein BKA70DRAFT_1354804 [Coprinopsis sp. MPI-PUGE-AT-0042]